MVLLVAGIADEHQDLDEHQDGGGCSAGIYEFIAILCVSTTYKFNIFLWFFMAMRRRRLEI